MITITTYIFIIITFIIVVISTVIIIINIITIIIQIIRVALVTSKVIRSRILLLSLHKKRNFPLRISSVNVAKSAGNCHLRSGGIFPFSYASLLFNYFIM